MKVFHGPLESFSTELIISVYYSCLFPLLFPQGEWKLWVRNYAFLVSILAWAPDLIFACPGSITYGEEGLGTEGRELWPGLRRKAFYWEIHLLSTQKHARGAEKRWEASNLISDTNHNWGQAPVHKLTPHYEQELQDSFWCTGLKSTRLLSHLLCHNIM